MAALPSAFKSSLSYLPVPIFTPSNPPLLAPTQPTNNLGPLQLTNSLRNTITPAHQLSTLPPTSLTSLPSSTNAIGSQPHQQETILNNNHHGLSVGNCNNSPTNSHDNVVKNIAIYSAKQLSKLKRFLTTLRQFGSDISPEVGEKVRGIILDLVNAALSVDEFQHKLQDITNFPIRQFVAQFLRSTIPLLRQELSECAQLSIRPSLPSLNSIYPTPPTTPYYHHRHPSSPLDFYNRNWPSGHADCKLMMYGQNIPTPARVDLKRKEYNESLAERLDSENYRKKGKNDSENNLMLDQVLEKITPMAPYFHENSKINPASAAILYEPQKSINRTNSDKQEIQILAAAANKNVKGAEVSELGDFLQSMKGVVRKAEGLLTKLNQQSNKNDQIEGKAKNKQDSDKYEEEVQQKEELERSHLNSRNSEKNGNNKDDQDRSSAFSQVKNQSGCWHCGKKASETCGGCKIARYCSVSCQHKDWNVRHHVVCWQLLTRHPKTDPSLAAADTCYKDTRLEPRCSKEIAAQNLKNCSGKSRKS
ncbi:uncharacterized protein TRIADDRAFT_53660 [Trichoplax adhaerens]|uniref:MYND-type domain-containing protein n=1 Tax=Trichoplax adhaerens TaxID=10228 RepID=B3RPU0_TRIAD|nr:hypothetical protein TRIADDRAFT_53660 [Trichoplax adhaerens]EDV28244.1 hypothetical protein TRIADDRAFT_53660 [Trichoplax adhaerens]|eukprot:XP_002110078.1 hypothetical protein TRIADDRAFT_53660 [Trichoplax adhaerens]